uniref:Transmembrane and coiled-coil domain-containing protein 4 n=1 Tax=Ascaris lumbricoides TaxID=6252 RepID=A0A0M3IIZ9_ASCLU
LKGEGTTDDVTSLITVIREDPFLCNSDGVVLLGCMLMIFIERGKYDCRCRVLLRHMSALLGVRWDDFEDMEDGLTDWIVEQEYNESEDSKLARARSKRIKKYKRYALIGAASGLGGVLIGLTGGLAAPFVAAGAGVLIGTSAAAGIATTAGAAVLGSAFGVAGAGLAGYKMNKRVGEIEEFSIEVLSEGSSLRCVLVVSGWIDELSERAFHQQWRHLWMSREQYTLRYESRYLVELGRAIDYLMSFAVSIAIQQTLLETALHGLMVAVSWPVALLGCASVLDNPWNVCVSRASEVGEHLAEVLLNRSHGERPITLIGFSLGARVLYHCLLAMSKRPNCLGLVEDVVLLGAPVSASSKEWSQICRVVGGRIINGYCNTDWLLRFLYRTMSVQFTIAGTGPVETKNEHKIVNFNLSHIVKGHLDYSRKLTEVLDAVGVKVTPHSDESLINLAKYFEDGMPVGNRKSEQTERCESITFSNESQEGVDCCLLDKLTVADVEKPLEETACVGEVKKSVESIADDENTNAGGTQHENIRQVSIKENADSEGSKQ